MKYEAYFDGILICRADTVGELAYTMLKWCKKTGLHAVKTEWHDNQDHYTSRGQYNTEWIKAHSLVKQEDNK